MRKCKHRDISWFKASLLMLGCLGLSTAVVPATHAQNSPPSLPGSVLPDDSDLAPLSDEALDAYLEQNATLPLDASNVTLEPPTSKNDARENVRSQAFDAALQGLLPLRPEEIRKLLERFDRTQESVELPVYPPPRP